MELVDNETFLKRLADLFERKSTRGTIWLTHKRLTYDGEDNAATAPTSSDDRDYPCLVRAIDGKDVKFSTHVNPADLIKFHAAYGALLKSSMSTLRKRDKKREKQRAEQAAIRKQRLTEPVIVEGAKRGKGRRKRQRMEEAAKKQLQAQQKAREREVNDLKLKNISGSS